MVLCQLRELAEWITWLGAQRDEPLVIGPVHPHALLSHIRRRWVPVGVDHRILDDHSIWVQDSPHNVVVYVISSSCYPYVLRLAYTKKSAHVLDLRNLPISTYMHIVILVWLFYISFLIISDLFVIRQADVSRDCPTLYCCTFIFLFLSTHFSPRVAQSTPVKGIREARS